MGQKGRPARITDRGFNVPDYYAPKNASTPGMPSWVSPELPSGYRGALDDLRDEVDKKKDTPPRVDVSKKDKDRLKIRTQNEIFGNEEIQRWYIEHIKEALEKMDGDKLYDFIRAHQSYGKNHFRAWNAELAELLGISVPEKYRGENTDWTNRRIAAGVQHVLVDFYNTDVFQLSYTKEKINPWIFIDGKMGPYSISVLSDYWMVRWGENSNKSPKPPGNAALAAGYEDKEKSRELYDDALRHLWAQTHRPKTGTETNS